jgi:hypothetical protein
MAEEEEKDPTIKIPTEKIVPTDSELPAIIYDEQVSEAYINNNRQLDADIRLKEETAKGNNDGFAWGMGAATELGLGFGGSLAYARWAQGGIGVLRGVKGASHLATLGGPVGWGAKAATHTVANMGIWALSNTLGQTVRTSLSDNTKFSAGELFAATVFGGFAGPSSKAGLFISGKANKVGAGAVSKIDDIIFKIGGESATNSQLFKGAIKVAEIGGKGATRFVGGGSFAVGETALRQELQLILGERESRDKTEWLYAMGIGGTINVAVRGGTDLFSGSKVQQKLVESFRDTFAGRILMRRAIKGGVERLDKEISKHEKIIKEIDKNPRANPDADKPNWNDIDLRSQQIAQVTQLQEAKFLLKDFQKGVHADSIKMGDKIPPLKDTKKIVAGEEVSVPKTAVTMEMVDDLVFDTQRRTKELAAERLRQDKINEELKSRGEEAPQELVEITDMSTPRQKAKEYSDALDEQDQELIRQFVRIRKGEEKGSPVDVIKQLIANREVQLALKMRAEDRLDYDWAKSGWAKQDRNKKKNFETDLEGVEISQRALMQNEVLAAEIKAYKEYVKYGEQFSQLSEQIAGTSLATGGRTKATAIVEVHKKRLSDKIKKAEAKLDEELAPDAAGSLLTHDEIKAKANSDIKHLKSYLKDLERSQKTAAEFDEIVNKIDNRLAVSMEEFNALSKQQQKELIKGRAEKLNTTPKKLTTEITSLKKKAKKASNKLEADAIRREEAEFFKSIKKSYEDGLEVNWISKEGIKRGIRWGMYASKLSYIGQVRSVIPSLTTGAYSVAYKFTRPLARLLAENQALHPSTIPKKQFKQAWMTGAMDVYASLSIIKELPSIPKSMWQSWKNLKSVARGGELESGYVESSKLTLNNKKEQISAIAERGDKEARGLVANQNLQLKIKDLASKGQRGVEQLLLLNVRNLTAVDDAFVRLIARQELEAKAGAQAIREFPDDFKKMWARKDELFNEWMPKGADGVRSIKMQDELEEFWSSLNEDIMWSAARKDFTHADTVKAADRFIDKWGAFKRKSKVGYEAEMLELGISPYTSIGIRTWFLSMKYMTSPLRVAPRQLHADKIPILNKMGAGATTGQNPYKNRIDTLTKQIDRTSSLIRAGKVKDILGEDIPLTPKRIEQLRNNKIEFQKQRKVLETKRIEHNITEYQRAMAAAGLFTTGMSLGGLGIYHGTNLWKTQKQKDHDKMAGVTTHSIETPYGPMKNLNSSGVQESVLSLGASIGHWLQLKENGKLKEGQEFPAVMLLSNLAAPYTDSPFNQGVRAIGGVVGDTLHGREFDKSFWAKMLGGLNPTPAEVRNLNKILRGNGYTKDLKGGTFIERVIYQKWGTGLVENNFDVLGRPIKETTNWGTNFLRFTPHNENVNLNTELRAFERIALDDTHGIMPTRFLDTDSFIYNEKARDWRNEEGYTFRTEFARRLREEFGGGLQDEVNSLIAEIGEETFRLKGKDDRMDGVMVAGRTSFNEVKELIEKAYADVRESFKVDIDNNAQYLNKYISQENGNIGFLDYIKNQLNNEQVDDDSVKRRGSNILRFEFEGN